jgi:multicomponent Na+:H+ antiporter subunit B
MDQRTRVTIFSVAAAALGALLLWCLHGLPPIGHYRGPYGLILNAPAPHVRQVSNVVTAVNYDYRGFDTLGEEFILFTAVGGVALLLRERHDEEDLPEARFHDRLVGRFVPEQTEAVRGAGFVFFALTVLFAIYIILHGHLTPGGGFQGGSILASGWVLAYLANSYHVYHRMSPQTITEAFDSAGAGAYVLIGLAIMATGAAFLQNVLPYGQFGRLLSAGTIGVINCAVGVEVTAAFIVVFAEFLKQLVALRKRQALANEEIQGS